MLSDDQKKIIKEEETYREEVKKELASNDAQKKGIISFLETQSGLFLASTIVLPLILWVYSASVSYHNNHSDQKNLIKSLDAEIAYRISISKPYLDKGNISFYLQELDSKHAFPQYSGTKIYALLSLLENEVPESEKYPLKLLKESLLSESKKDISTTLSIRQWK